MVCLPFGGGKAFLRISFPFSGAQRTNLGLFLSPPPPLSYDAKTWVVGTRPFEKSWFWLCWRCSDFGVLVIVWEMKYARFHSSVISDSLDFPGYPKIKWIQVCLTDVFAFSAVTSHCSRNLQLCLPAGHRWGQVNESYSLSQLGRDSRHGRC